MALPSSAWVPTTMSIWPSAMPFLTRLSSADDTSRDACPICTGKPLKRSVKVLVCCRAKQRGRHHHRHLLAAHHRGEGRAQRHFGLAEADVAANQPVHRAAVGEIVERGVDRGLLVVGFLVGKARGEFVGCADRDRRAAALREASARPRS